jgi:hypothetical protein
LPVLYVASFGPAVCITGHLNLNPAIVEHAYEPILWQLINGPDWPNAPIWWYGSIGVPDGRYPEFRVKLGGDGSIVYAIFGGPPPP